MCPFLFWLGAAERRGRFLVTALASNSFRGARRRDFFFCGICIPLCLLCCPVRATSVVVRMPGFCFVWFGKLSLDEAKVFRTREPRGRKSGCGFQGSFAVNGFRVLYSFHTELSCAWHTMEKLTPSYDCMVVQLYVTMAWLCSGSSLPARAVCSRCLPGQCGRHLRGNWLLRAVFVPAAPPHV